MARAARNRKGFMPRTAVEAQQWLRAHGVTVSEFARHHGFNRNTVQDLLRGRTQGNFGSAHAAAIALGMKAGPNCATKFPIHTKPKA